MAPPGSLGSDSPAQIMVVPTGIEYVPLVLSHHKMCVIVTSQLLHEKQPDDSEAILISIKKLKGCYNHAIYKIMFILHFFMEIRKKRKDDFGFSSKSFNFHFCFFFFFLGCSTTSNND